jgi:hypothetical protein
MVDAKIDLPADIDIKKDSLLAKLPIVFLGFGIACLIYWLVLFKENPSRSMFSYLYAFIVVLSLALGSLIFVLVQHITRAGWSVVVRRMFETMMALLPLFILFFLPIAFYASDLFTWMHSDHIDAILQKKLGYLNEPFFLLRSFAYIFVWAALGVWFYRSSVKQDSQKDPKITYMLQALSGPSIIIFGITITFASFDWLMSLEPHWYSTMFGVYFYAGSILFALAFVTLMIIILQSNGLLSEVSGDHFHDLGKLMFGFTIFWAYISFSQFMLYWYGGIPEEIEFYSHRLEHGFETLSWAMPLIHFFIPFFLLMSRTLKRVKSVLAFNCLWIIFAHLADLYWLILPMYHDPLAHEEAFHVSLSDLLALGSIFLTVLGVYLLLLSRRKLIAIGDPRLKESLAFENF